MTQSKSRRLLYQQARLIRIQWAVILALVCTIVLMAIFLPKAKAVEETAAPTLELEPTSYATPEIMPEPIIEIEPEETEPVLEELGEFRLTAYCACRKCCGKDPGDFGYGGSVGAMKSMGALAMGLEESELKPIVNSWRAANKSITKFWWDTDAAVRRCITTQAPVDLPHGMRLRKQGPLMRLRLPNGRELSYVKPRVDGDDNITYEGTIQSSGGWGRIESYGPKFVENIVQAKFKNALSGLGSIASTALKGVTTAVAAVTTAVAGVATAAVKVGSGFESSMSQVAATMGLTVEDIRNGSEEFELLSQAAKDAGATTAFSASEAADALNYLALAGYDAATSADVLPSVLNLAAAGGLDLAYASDLATDAMAALGIEASSTNLTEFGDKMAKTASKANTSVGQLGEAILTVGGTAKSLAGGTTELNAALGVLANRGIKGAEGGTALRNVILALSAPTDKAADAMSALGLEVYDAVGNMRPLNEVFRDLDSALSGMTEGEKTKVLNEIFNKVDLKSAQALLAGCGEEFDNLAAAIDDSAGAMQNMADTQLDNLQGDVTIMKSALEGLGISVYENLQAPLRDTVQFATELVGQLSEALNENGLEGLVSAAGDVLSEVLLKITSELPKFIDIGVKVIKSLISGLWKATADPAEEWPVWSQPQGAHDAYAKGAKVLHSSKRWTSDVDNNVWEPGVYGWTEVTE